MNFKKLVAILMVLFVVAGIGFSQSRSTSRFTLTVNSNVRNSQVLLNAILQNGRTPLRLTLPTGTYSITVRSAGYRDYTVEVNLTRNSTVNATLQPITNTLTVNSNVNDAAVYINNDLKGTAPLRLTLSPGRYTVRVIAPGHTEFSQVVDLNRTMTIGANLEAITHSLRVTANINGASVYVNNDLKGNTPTTVQLNAGRYSVRVTAPGYVDHSQAVDLSQDISVSATLQPITYTLSVNSSVNGAAVYVDNNRSGNAPASVTLEPGNYTVRVEADGYVDFSQSVELSRNTTVSATLQLITYTLSVSSNVSGAAVFIDNNRTGNAPASATLKPGNYTVKVVASDYLEFSQTVELNRNITVSAVLKPSTADVSFVLPEAYRNKNERNALGLFRLYIDGRRLSAAQINGFKVDGGTRQVRIESGGVAFEAEYNFEAGKTYQLEVNMNLLLKPVEN